MNDHIDERVVQMQFDNKQFERGISTSMNSISKLKKNLDFTEANKGIEKLEKAGRRMDLSPIGNAFDKVSLKISAFEVAGITAIQNIVNKAVNAGQKLIRSFTVDPIMDGWNKLAEKTQAVATLSAQGYDMGEIEEQVERLQFFADETSYSFTEMLKTVTKFTASGKSFKDSVTTVMGIANAAALSGANAQTASNAMYQIAQAMGRSFNQMDWRSIQNASMDTTIFRQKILEASAALGYLKDNGDGTFTTLKGDIVDTDNFLAHFTESGLLNGDVMVEVGKTYAKTVDDIKRYSEENSVSASEAIDALSGSLDEFSLNAFRAGQECRTWGDVVGAVKEAVASGWSGTFEAIFGNYKEQRELWGSIMDELYEFFVSAGDERTKLLQDWKELGGRKDIIEGISNAFYALKERIDAVREAFRDVFPKKTAEDLKSASSYFARLTAKLKPSETALKRIKQVVTVIAVPIRILLNSVKEGFKIVGALALVLFRIVTNFKTVLSNVVEMIRQNERLNAVLEKVIGFINRIKEAFAGVSEAITEAFSEKKLNAETFAKVGGAIAAGIARAIPVVLTAGKNIIAGLIRGIAEEVPKLVTKALEVGKAFVNEFCSFMQIESPSKRMFQIGKWVVLGLIAGIAAVSMKVGQEGETLGQLILNFFEKLNENSIFHAFSTGVAAVPGKLGEILTAVRDWIKKFTDSINVGTLVATGFAVAIASIGVAFGKTMFSMAKVLEGAAKALSGLGGLLTGLTNSVNQFAKMLKAARWTKVVKDLAVSLAILVGAFIGLAMFYKHYNGDLLGAIGLFTGIVVFLGVAMYVFTLIANSAPELAATMRQLGLAMASFAVIVVAAGLALRALKDVPWYAALAGAVGIGIVVTALGFAMRLVSKANVDEAPLIKFAIAVGIMALSIRMMSKSIRILIDNAPKPSEMSALGLSLLAVGVVLLSGAAMLMKLGDSGKPLAAALAVTLFVGALLGLFGVIRLMADPERMITKKQILPLVTNVGAIAIIMTGIVFAIRKAGDAALKAGAGVLMLTAGISMIGFMLRKFGESIGSGREVGRVFIIAAILAGLTIVVGKLAKFLGAAKRTTSKGKNDTLRSLSKLIISIGVLVASLAILQLFDTKKLVGAAAALSLCLVAISLVFKYIDKDVKTGPALAMALETALIAAALIWLQRYDFRDVLASALALSACIAALALVFSQAGKTKKMGPILAMAVATVAIGGVLAGLLYLGSGPDAWKTILAAGAAIAGCLLAFGFGLKKVSGAAINTQKIYAFTLSMVAIGAALLGLTALNKDETGWLRIAVAGAAIAGCLLAFGFGLKAIGKTKVDTASLLAMAGALVAIGLSLGVLAAIGDWQTILAATGAMLIVIATMVAALKILENVQNVINNAVALGIAISAIALAMSVGIAIMGDANGIIRFALAMGIVIATFAGSLVLLDKLGSAGGIVTMIALAAAITVVALALATAMAIVGDPTGCIRFAIAMGVAIGAFTLFALALGATFDISILGAAVLLALAAGLVLVGGAAALMAVSVKILANSLPSLAAGLTMVGAALPAVANGLRDFLTTTASAFEEGAVKIANSVYILAYGIGYNAIAGFVIGIRSALGAVWNAGSDMGAAALDGLRTRLDSHSPAEETIDTGEDTGLGYLIGLKDKSILGLIGDAGAKLGDSALGGVLSKVGSFTNAGELAGSNFVSGLNNFLASIGLDGLGSSIFGEAFNQDEWNRLKVEMRRLGTQRTEQQAKMNAAKYAADQLRNEGKVQAGSVFEKEKQERKKYEQLDEKYQAAVKALDEYEQKTKVGKYAPGKQNASSKDEDSKDEDSDNKNNNTTTDGGGGGSSAAIEEEIKSVKTLTKYILKEKDAAWDLNRAVEGIVDSYQVGEDVVLSFSTMLAMDSKEIDDAADLISLTINDLEDALKSYQKTLKSAAESSAKIFQKYNKGDILNIEDIIGSFESQMEGLGQYQMYTSQALANGLDPQILKKIVDEYGLDGEGFGYVEALANATESEIETINSYYRMTQGVISSMPEFLLSSMEEAFYMSSTEYRGIGQATIDNFARGLREEWLVQGIALNEIPEEMILATKGVLDDKLRPEIEESLNATIEAINESYDNPIVLDVDLDTTDAYIALAGLKEAIGGGGPTTDSANAAHAGVTEVSYYPANGSAVAGTVVNYTQNISSPKALNATEVYRYTNRGLNKVVSV